MGTLAKPAAFFVPRFPAKIWPTENYAGLVQNPGSAKPPFLIIGHRGVGKNGAAWEADAWEGSGRVPLRPFIRENTVESLNKAAECGADFVEFDVQVTRDGCPVLFHDNFIITADGMSRKISELVLEEFRAIGVQRDSQQVGKKLMRQVSGRPGEEAALVPWVVREDAPLPTLREAFQLVEPSLGFNCEVKFIGEDSSDSSPAEIMRMLDAILEVVTEHRGDRKVFFSSFHPDAVVELRRRCDPSTFPVSSASAISAGRWMGWSCLLLCFDLSPSRLLRCTNFRASHMQQQRNHDFWILKSRCTTFSFCQHCPSTVAFPVPHSFAAFVPFIECVILYA
eukprot:TRINITY_DN7454_c0_g1_i1.p1 TRINITY_DN7454_c0_g1~~TRINITY_DN7454_c0_g1_i1.p1  ORF type:complete len:338 (-),score=39.19 TRINITY_DN7454_c0_g1_i1:174-1187(-)